MKEFDLSIRIVLNDNDLVWKSFQIKAGNITTLQNKINREFDKFLKAIKK